MIDTNIIKHIMSTVAEPGEDNTISQWSDNVEILYGSIMINDEHCMYIKAKEMYGYKETLVDISMPVAAFEKCRYEISQHLLELLIKPD